MAASISVQKVPHPKTVKIGRSLRGYARGPSGNLLLRNRFLCDTGVEPFESDREATDDLWLCGCKATHDQPSYDGIRSIF